MRAILTVKFLDDALHSAGATAAGHRDIKLILVFRHGERKTQVLH